MFFSRVTRSKITKTPTLMISLPRIDLNNPLVSDTHSHSTTANRQQTHGDNYVIRREETTQDNSFLSQHYYYRFSFNRRSSTTLSRQTRSTRAASRPTATSSRRCATTTACRATYTATRAVCRATRTPIRT